ncbi:CAP domain-containing protein [Halocynthiibacter sp. C4]|uniref:CAP domain-containing protein n=1 Tax=Halocynthiibacter sp. C4 TaxID=2992758 RepID=UPI00237A2086|nr:CAP domain-containing protein [Halocynthiibacter sp. C4]MDE0590218.1 CAP domain-containing protein [Halocynthiibacter sp. C4]
MTIKFGAIAAVAAFMLAACSEQTTVVTAGGGNDLAVSLEDIVNFERRNASLPELTSNAQLDAAALALAEDMNANGFVGHTGTDGSTVKDRVEATGYCARVLAENAYRGERGGIGAIDWWMQSPPHRANILNSKVTEFGMAGSGQSWAMVLAGRPC